LNGNAFRKIKMKRKFSCVQGCSDCCIYRDYYPSVRYGKIGVLVLPDEKPVLESIARGRNIEIKILPRLASGTDSPDTIIAYQMMGKNDDGDLCPFLDVEGTASSPHGGFRCGIYDRRPAACRAYPVIDSAESAQLDEHCQFCKQFSTTRANVAGLEDEIAALGRIKEKVRGTTHIWRYATATGKTEDKSKMAPEGWIREE
jgi:Fe-S-cluster containining protein